MADVQAAIEEYLAGLPDEDWQALCARVRPPDESPREFVARLFGTAQDPEPDEPDDATQRLSVAGEGSNPPTRISAAAYNADFVKRLFDDYFDVVQPELPEPEEIQ